MTWMTNTPDAPYHRLRQMVKCLEDQDVYFVGPPMESDKYSVEDLQDMGYIGIYLAGGGSVSEEVS